MGEIVSRML